MAAGALGALMYTFNRMDDRGALHTEELNAPPRYTLSDAELTRFDGDGDAVLRGTAASVQYYDDDSARATALAVDLIENDQVIWHITAPSGMQPAHDRRMLLDSAVNATGAWPDTHEPLTVNTSQMWIDADAHTLQTGETVTANSKTRRATGRGMLADWSAQWLRLLHDVKMRYEKS